VAALSKPAGALVIRTFFICLTYAAATAVTARSGTAPAAAHQVRIKQCGKHGQRQQGVANWKKLPCLFLALSV
jgi:hypothetical protein